MTAILRGVAAAMLLAAVSLPSGAALAREPFGESGAYYQDQSRFRDADEDWVYARDRAARREGERRHFYEEHQDRTPEPRRAGYRERQERCTRGNAGTILGAIAGGLLGNAAIGRHGNHAVGTLGGAGAGALIGSAADGDCT